MQNTLLPEFHLSGLEFPFTPSAIHAERMLGPMMPNAIEEAASDPDPSNMFMRMFYLLQAVGKEKMALEMQAKALERRSLYRVADPAVPEVKLLALMGPGTMLDNTPLDYVIQNSNIRLDLLYVHPDLTLPESIPDHDIAIIALAESDKSRPLLNLMNELIANWPRPVLNKPLRILGCSRNAVFQQLKDIPNLLVPEVHRCDRAQVMNTFYPMTIRPLDTHCGRGLMKINSREELDVYLENSAEDDFFVSEYVDYRSKDGQFRKYRVAMIDGAAFAVHMAISRNWMIHYLNADMYWSEANRAEEAQFIEHFDEDFAVRHHEAFRHISERVALDYFLLDCAETEDGDLLIFEIGSAMIVHSLDPEQIFPYKRPQMEKIFFAFDDLLRRRKDG